MIKNLNVCICDVCGAVRETVPVAASRNEITYSPPPGWSKGINNGIDICPECGERLSNMKKMRGSE